MTGCLRVSKESIFTGLNNLSINTIADAKYDEWFGFTDEEVRRMLDYYGASMYYQITKNWYDGYRFGQTSMYCPWDVLNWCSYLQSEPNPRPQNFWVNTSGNDLISQFADAADAMTRQEIGILLEGGSIMKPIQLDLTYAEMDDTIDNLWSVLFMTGYLTYRKLDERGFYELTSPNREITNVFGRKVDEWFTRKVMEDKNGLQELFKAFDDEDAPEIENCLNDYMIESISYLDGGKIEEKEAFYHGLLLGMLKSRGSWNVQSNREAGKGRLDILIYPRRLEYAIIIEVKYACKESELEKMAETALKQIQDNRYDAIFGRRKPKKMIHYGIAFCRKDCRVLKEDG